jgi:ribonuclease HI
MSRTRLPRCLAVFTDGAIRPELGISGLAAVVGDAHGTVYGWWAERAGRLTCNEAEYAAVLLALGRLAGLPQQSGHLELDFYSDSRVVVEQMQGRAAAHSPAMRQALGEARRLSAAFARVTFSHVPRRQNRLADALANNAVEGAGRENCAAFWDAASSRDMIGAARVSSTNPAQDWLSGLLARLAGSGASGLHRRPG